MDKADRTQVAGDEELYFCCTACGLDGKVTDPGARNVNAVAPGDTNYETYRDHPAWVHAACDAS
jgi:hypothetical protein